MQRNRERNNNGKQDSKKKTKPSDLTLLEILCADFENGTALLSKRTGVPTDVGDKTGSLNLGQGRFKKAGQITEHENKPVRLDSDESLKLKGNVERAAQSRSSKNLLETIRCGDGDTTDNQNSCISRLKTVSSEGVSSDNSSTESRISEWCLSSQETAPLRERFAQTVSWTSEEPIDRCELGEDETSLQTVSQLSKKTRLPEKLTVLSASSDDPARKNEKSILSSRTGLSERDRDSQTSQNYRFVHFKEGRKPARRKGKKENCVDRSKDKEKLNRTRSSGVKLFQVEGLQSSQKRKSQVRPPSRGVR